MTQATAKVIEHSVNERGVELITLQLRYQRFIHAEFMTHRVFSRNASSSRAIPVAKMLEQVRTEPAMPVHWGKNQPGMQANEECNELINVPVPLTVAFDIFLHEQGLAEQDGAERWATRELWWRFLGWVQAYGAEAYAKAGYHKQVVNRRLEADQFISVIVTATEWDNFFELRDHPDAQPEIRALAVEMKKAIEASRPVLRSIDNHGTSAYWHLPYVTKEERVAHYLDPRYLAKLSAARCARVSYLTHDGQQPDPQKDLELYERLVGSKPLHASPVEHQAYPRQYAHAQWDKNFRDWHQFRSLIEEEAA